MKTQWWLFGALFSVYTAAYSFEASWPWWTRWALMFVLGICIGGVGARIDEVRDQPQIVTAARRDEDRARP